MRISTRIVCAAAVLTVGYGVHAAAQGTAGTIHGCVGRDNSLRVVDYAGGCKPNERPLDWNIAQPAPNPGSGSGGLRVRNAFGADLGPLVGPGHVLLTLPTGQKSYALLHADVAPADSEITQWYQSADCSGEPLLSISVGEELIPQTHLTRTGAWAVRPGTTTARDVASFVMVNDSGTSACMPLNGSFSFITSQFDFYTPDQLGLIAPFSVE